MKCSNLVLQNQETCTTANHGSQYCGGHKCHGKCVVSPICRFPSYNLIQQAQPCFMKIAPLALDGCIIQAGQSKQLQQGALRCSQAPPTLPPITRLLCHLLQPFCPSCIPLKFLSCAERILTVELFCQTKNIVGWRGALNPPGASV